MKNGQAPWTIETLNEVVDREIASLPKEMQATFLRLSDRIVAVGLERVGPPSVKHLRGKLWEMRFRGRDGIGRAIYVSVIGRRVVILHVFVKKSQRTPGQALELAEKRAREIK